MAPQKSKSQNKQESVTKIKKTVKRTKTGLKKTTTKKPTQAKVIKPKVRVSRVSVGLGIKPQGGQDVVDLKGLAKSVNQAVDGFKDKPTVKSAKNYGADIYDEELDKNEEAIDDDLANEPVESLGELLDDDERLSYDDAEVAKTVKQKIAKAPQAKTADAGSGRVYRRIAVGFVVLVFLISLAVAYFVLVKVKIGLTLKNEALTGEFQLNVYDQSSSADLPEKSLKGLVKKIEIEQSKAFGVAGSEIIGEEVSGKMIIYNKYIKNQPLVATTRLLGIDGKLFRLKNSVNVPAGGQLEVEVYADQPKADMQVGDERFTIPGLWDGLQDKVYAESKAGDIAYKKKTKGVVSQEDIDKAKQELKDLILAQAKTEVESTYGDFNKQLYQLDEASLTSEVDSKVGEEKEEIVLKMKASILVAAFSGEEALALVKNQAITSLTAGKELAEIKDEAIDYDLLKVDLNQQLAEIKASFAGQVSVTSLDDLIDRRKLTNLNEDQLTAYLKGVPEVADFNIYFYPPFIKKTPALVDRIEVVLEK